MKFLCFKIFTSKLFLEKGFLCSIMLTYSVFQNTLMHFLIITNMKII
jgi:hypothetical protein